MRRTRAQRAMAAKPTLKAIAAARAMQAPLDHVAAPLAKPKRRQKITDDMSLDKLAGERED